ncbi:MAG TPA: cell division protein FtsZ [Candidatus Absconditabacterales bacterium]|nr:cell division protein FtsZ [Candidatus Absconditabacterales bacterium]HPK27835.1 cell division protein FtsZ [Candidatus Absconditabacterales bacterium]
MIINEIKPDFIPGAKIKVLGIGGCGNKAVNRMISEGLEKVDFVAINTDAQDLANNLASKKVNIGLNLTKGLGAGANPEIGRKAAEESETDIKNMLQDTDMVFITLGMGGGTGTGAGPVIANIAKEMGILTIGVVTKPFSFEGKKREIQAEEGLAKIKNAVDTLIVIPNDKIFNVIDKKTTFKQAFLMIDKILYSGIKGISDLITKPGDINIDFADIRVVMQNSGNALLGIGYGAGEKRAVDAARKAIENPLLETNIDKAKNVIFAVAGGLDLTPTEVQEAASVIEDIIDPEVNMIWGMSLDESMEDEVQVTIIATGFEEQSKDPIIKSPNRDMLGRPTAPKKVTESFIERIVRTNNEDDNDEIDTEEDNNQWEGEDLETPAFMRKRLNPEN